jgi:transposase-like protein
MAGLSAAETRLRLLRWPETGGAPVCPHCSSVKVYALRVRARFRCADCARDFTTLSGTALASAKKSAEDIIKAAEIVAEGWRSGASILKASQRLGVQYKTAYVLAMKMRDAIEAEPHDATGDVSDTILAACLRSPVNHARKGYWQRRKSSAARAMRAAIDEELASR